MKIVESEDIFHDISGCETHFVGKYGLFDVDTPETYPDHLTAKCCETCKWWSCIGCGEYVPEATGQLECPSGCRFLVCGSYACDTHGDCTGED